MNSPQAEVGLEGLILGTFRSKDTAIMLVALLERHCNKVVVRRLLAPSEGKNVKWKKYQYIWVTPEYYRLFASFLERLKPDNGHFVAIFTSNRKEFEKLQTELKGDDDKNGFAKIMYVNRELFAVTSSPG